MPRLKDGHRTQPTSWPVHVIFWRALCCRCCTWQGPGQWHWMKAAHTEEEMLFAAWASCALSILPLLCCASAHDFLTRGFSGPNLQPGRVEKPHMKVESEGISALHVPSPFPGKVQSIAMSQRGFAPSWHSGVDTSFLTFSVRTSILGHNNSTYLKGC